MRVELKNPKIKIFERVLIQRHDNWIFAMEFMINRKLSNFRVVSCERIYKNPIDKIIFYIEGNVSESASRLEITPESRLEEAFIPGTHAIRYTPDVEGDRDFNIVLLSTLHWNSKMDIRDL